MAKYLLILHDATIPTDKGRDQLKENLGKLLGLAPSEINRTFEQLPAIMKRGLSKELADSLKTTYEELGAIAEVLEEAPTTVHKLSASEEKALDSSKNSPLELLLEENKSKPSTDIQLQQTLETTQQPQLSSTSEPETDFSNLGELSKLLELELGKDPTDLDLSFELPDIEETVPEKNMLQDKSELNKDLSIGTNLPTETKEELTEDNASPIFPAFQKADYTSQPEQSYSSTSDSEVQVNLPDEEKPILIITKVKSKPSFLITFSFLGIAVALGFFIAVLGNPFSNATSYSASFSDPNFLKQLLIQQHEIWGSGTQLTDNSSGPPKKKDIWQGGLADEKRNIKIRLATIDDKINNLALEFSFNPPPKPSPQEIVQGIKEYPWIRRAVIQDLEVTQVTQIDKFIQTFIATGLGHAYLSDTKGQARNLCLIQIKAEIDFSKKIISGIYSISDQESISEDLKKKIFVERVSQDKFKFNYQENITMSILELIPQPRKKKSTKKKSPSDLHISK